MREVEEHHVDADYRALNPLAIVALFLGIASPAAFIGRLLLLIPAAAMGVAGVALAQIRAAEGRQSGAAMARCGAYLAVFCVVALLTREVVGESLIRRQTLRLAQQWAELLASNRLDEALGLVTPRVINSYAPRRGPDAPPMAERQLREYAMEGLKRDAFVQLLQSGAAPARLRPASWALSPVTDAGVERFSCVFEVLAEPPIPGNVLIDFSRPSRAQDGDEFWRIVSWQYDGSTEP